MTPWYRTAFLVLGGATALVGLAFAINTTLAGAPKVPWLGTGVVLLGAWLAWVARKGPG